MKQITYIFLLFLLVFAGCASKTEKHDAAKVQHADVVIERFDKDFLNCLNDGGVSYQQDLAKKYPVLLPAFAKVVSNVSDRNQKQMFSVLNKKFLDSTLQKIYTDAVTKFDNVESLEKELTAANSRLWENFPGKTLPRFSMHVSGLKQNVIVTDSLVSISIDKYLGEDYPFYKDYFYDYQRSQMQSKYVVRDYLRAYVISSLMQECKNLNLISAMICEGKCLYVISKLLPNISSEDLVGYTEKHYKWCEENERSVWRTTIERKYLYNSEYMLVSKYMNDAPCTSLISPLCPGKIGAWMGLHIVRSFVKNNSGVGLEELLKMDEHRLLELSKYNP